MEAVKASSPNDEASISQRFDAEKKNCCTPEVPVYISSVFSVMTGVASVIGSNYRLLRISPIDPINCLTILCIQTFCDDSFGPGKTNCTGSFIGSAIPIDRAAGQETAYLSIALATLTVGIVLFSLTKTGMIQKKNFGCTKLWGITIPSSIIAIGCAAAAISIASINLSSFRALYIRCNSTALSAIYQINTAITRVSINPPTSSDISSAFC